MTDAQTKHAAAHPQHPVAMREQRALARDEVSQDLAGPAFFLAYDERRRGIHPGPPPS
jgi:hypothetical protein